MRLFSRNLLLTLFAGMLLATATNHVHSGPSGMDAATRKAVLLK